ncbi:MAG: exodeoxyribonuclease III [Candidatus Shapirobacteria bacterium]|nr:exodeoxyribonuclease III [Candidatus Shapirobacteria bacterium]MDD4410090.1 exodeoxyribonuclease III [Candidatus Shapirobacteria bacterium]
MKVKIISWNVAGMRAAVRKGLWHKMKEIDADIYCFQEVKARPEQVELGFDYPTGYQSYWNPAEKAGYSGVATFTKNEPKSVIVGDRTNDWGDEGRVIITKFDEFTLLNVYFPNGKRDKGRLDYKMKFYDYFLKYINELRDRGEKIIFCGDVNTAHQEIDLARPKDNELVSGFLEIERKWIDKVIKNGYVDTFRMFNPAVAGQYSWWSERSGARKRNVGWRIDYFFVDESLKDKVKSAFILPNVEGSDHCPVGIEIDLS